MRNEQAAPETKGVTVKLLAALDLGPESRHGRAPASNAYGDHRTWRRLRPDSRPSGQTRHGLHTARNDH